ncbi:MAG: TIGR01458 family HAD-type hydrolase [Rhizobiaceae bacterium]
MAFQGVLLDISGVIYVGDQPLPGAVEAVDRLKSAGLAIRYVTNTTRTPKRKILDKLASLGIPVDAAELFTPAQAACDYLKSHSFKPHLLIHPNLAEDFAGVEPGDASKDVAVIVGDAGDGFTYRTLNEAFHLLRDGAEFVALAANRTFKDDSGEISLDTGAFVAALEYGSQKTAIVLGKPASGFFQGAVAHMGLAPQDVAMVGDDAEADVSGALAAGLSAGILVRTGKYVPGAERDLDPEPTVVLDDLVAAADWILGTAD